MNKSNGGKQRKQKDTVIPMNNPYAKFHGKPQKMTMETGEAKGLQQTLEECGFDVRGMRVKCSPVCPFENNGCCMAHILSKQDDFCLQISLLKQKITSRGHLCIFLPKFHCKLNPIEMACISSSFWQYSNTFYWTVLGLVQTEIQGNLQRKVWGGQEGCMRMPWCMPRECDPSVLQLFLALHGCLSTGSDR
jgi:hypothetical protein